MSGRAVVLVAILLLGVAPAAADPRTWRPAPGQGAVAFDARFTLGDFSGESREVSGEVTFDALDLRRPIAGTLHVGVASLRTGSEGRDRDMRRLLEADGHPDIAYAIERVEASFPQISDKSDTLLTITGTLTIRGVARPVRFLGRVRQRGETLWARGEAQITMRDFGITPPRRLLFLKVADAVSLRFDLTLAAAP